MRALLSALLLLFGLGQALAQEEARVFPPADQKAMALRIARDFVAPRYQSLGTALRAQRDAWRGFCAAPDASGLAALAGPFAEAVEAWSRIELVRYGPITENFRHERIAYWPERKNDVSRALARLLAEPGTIDPASMAGRSVAVQGLSALERLLHEDGARETLLTGADAQKRCAAGEAITQNLVGVAEDVAAGWTAFARSLESADDALAREVVSRFATDLLTVYQIVGDAKLDVPMGSSVEEARPRLAQYWRSGLSNRAIAADLASAADLTALILGEDDVGVRATRAAARLAVELPAPLADLVVQNAGRSQVLLLRGAVRGARDLTSQTVPVALGVTIGFNSLDGD
jgi:predicted lipoprotein